MTYITGDTHGNFDRIISFCKNNSTTKDDILIILGDAGINYYGKRDIKLKETLKNLPITFFCIHGNHEKRPENIKTYTQTIWNDGVAYLEEAYPNLLFAKDGEVYSFGDKKAIVIGGAYSVDKFYRLSKGYMWWEDEQPSEEIKAYVEEKILALNNKIDIVLSHTAPYKYMPTETFLPFIDQNTVDSSTEKWLDGIEDALKYQKWYLGHYHINKRIDRIEILFEDVVEI